MAITIQYAGPIDEYLKRAASSSAYARAAQGGGFGGGGGGSRGGGGGGGRSNQAAFDLQANALDAQEAAQERAIGAQADRDERLNYFQSERDDRLHGYQGERIQQQADVAQAHDERAYAQRTNELLLREGTPLTYVEEQTMNQYANARGAQLANPDLSDEDRGRVLQQIDRTLIPLLNRQSAAARRRTLDENNTRLAGDEMRFANFPDTSSSYRDANGNPTENRNDAATYPDTHPIVPLRGQPMRMHNTPMQRDQHGMWQPMSIAPRPVIDSASYIRLYDSAEAAEPPIMRGEGPARMSDTAYQEAVDERDDRVQRRVQNAVTSFNTTLQNQRNPDHARTNAAAVQQITALLAPLITEYRQIDQQNRPTPLLPGSPVSSGPVTSALLELQRISARPTQANLARVPEIIASLPPAVRNRLVPRPPSYSPHGGDRVGGAGAGFLGGFSGSPPPEPRPSGPPRPPYAPSEIGVNPNATPPSPPSPSPTQPPAASTFPPLPPGSNANVRLTADSIMGILSSTLGTPAGRRRDALQAAQLLPAGPYRAAIEAFINSQP